MSTGRDHTAGRNYPALFMVLLMIGVLITPLAPPPTLLDEYNPQRTGTTWEGYDQPWPQYARTPTHNQTVPAHGPDGGPGEGSIDNVSTLGTLEHPVVNWQVFTDQSESDAYGSVIGDFSASVSASEAALERCGAGTLFPVMISSELSDGSRESFLNIVSGNDAKIAWRVSLGTTGRSARPG